MTQLLKFFNQIFKVIISFFVKKKQYIIKKEYGKHKKNIKKNEIYTAIKYQRAIKNQNKRYATTKGFNNSNFIYSQFK